MKFNFSLEEVKYIKINYEDKFSNPCSIKAAIKKINEREIIACRKFDDGISINTPQEVVLNIVSKDGLYITKTILKSAENDEPYAFFYLETPPGFEYQQNREFFRVPIDLDCVYCIKQNEDFININAKTVNLSANGICINIPSLVISEEDTILILNIDNRKLNVKLKYIRSEKAEEGYLASFSFTNLSELDRDFLSQICIKTQLEQKRKSIY